MLNSRLNWPHMLRRLVHINLCWSGILYYFIFPLGFFGLSREFWVSLTVFCILGFEFFRLKRKYLVFGQRIYEQNQISAAAWGAFAIGIILLFVPHEGIHGSAIALPLIFSLSFIDPLLGELRGFDYPRWLILLIGLLGLYLIWVWSYFYLLTQITLSFLLPPIILFSEWFKVSGIDDNATMLLIPFICILFIRLLI